MEPAVTHDLANLIVEPVTIIASPGINPVILGHDRQLVDLLDGSVGLIDGITSQAVFQSGAWRIVKRREASFQVDRVLFDCLAIKTTDGKSLKVSKT